MQPSSTGFNLIADKRRRSSFVGKTHRLFHEPTGRKVAPKDGKNYPDKAPVAAQAARSKALAAWKSFAATVISEVLESSASNFPTEPTGIHDRFHTCSKIP